MRTAVRFAACLLAAGFAFAPAFAEPKKWTPGPFAEARQRLLRGNYDEARAAFEDLAKKDAKLKPQAVVGIAETHRQVGDSQKALELLNEAVKATPDNPDLLAARSDLLFEMGNWDDANKDADAAIAKNDKQMLARWTKARFFRDTGRLDEADAAMRWFVKYYSSRSNADDDITNPDELLLVAHAGAENARWHNLSKQFAFILNEVISDAIKADADFWPAEVLAGNLLLEKYNRPDANEAFDKALKINPKAADALAGRGMVSLTRFEVKDADAFADQALKINSKHPVALRVKADVHLIAGDWPAAEKLLDRAKAANPRDAVSLGKLAACYLLARRGPEFEKQVKEAESFDAKPGAFYYELGNSLEERKRYSLAEDYLKKAAILRPMLAGPRTSLAMLYLRLGREKEGQELLTKAFELDPFNVRVANSIKVMKHLSAYATVQTPHYELRYDLKVDKVLAEFLAEFLEETHSELKAQFGFEPPNKILIQVFSTHEMFSGRVLGLPDLHTIGASTGNLVAMASPVAKGVKKPFNWGRVVRHELTHVFNLTQTNFLCPHWLTEGLAVRNENMAKPPMWISILRDRLAADTLFNLDTVMMGFVRPKNPDDWTLAYCQSNIYVEYLVKTHGEGAIGKLLEAYRDGKDTASAIQFACGVNKDVFEKGYRTHVEDLIKPYRSKAKTEEKPMTFEELETAHKKNPDDPELAAKLADQLFRRNKVAESRKLVEFALEKKPGHVLATIVKARLLSRAGDEDGARAILEESLMANPDEPRILLALGRAYVDTKDYENAGKVLEHGRKVAPLDGDWLEQLARLYKLTNETDKMISVLREVISGDPDELDGRLKLARVSLDANRPEEAERFARDAIQIDVNHEEARKVLIESLKAQGKTAEVEKVQKRFAEVK